MEGEYTQVVTPDGRVLVVVPLEDFEQLLIGVPLPSAKIVEAPLPIDVRNDIAAGSSPLAAWRRYRCLSQSRLARLSGVSRHTIMRMEAGGLGTGSWSSRSRIANTLAITVSEL